MFRIVLTILTAATFVAHGLFGCCWHHDHAHTVSTASGSKHTDHCHDHGQHRHSHQEAGDKVADHSGSRDSRAPHDGQCDKDECVFFARAQDGTQVPGDFLMACAFVLSTGIVDCMDVPTVGIAAATARNGSSSSCSPLCALSQVWLI